MGPGLEDGPRLDKRGSPRGLVSWWLLVVCGCWSQNGAGLFQFSFVVVVVPSGASCSSSVVVFCVWLESPFKRSWVLRLRLQYSGSCGLVFEIVCGTEVVCVLGTEVGADGTTLVLQATFITKDVHRPD